MSPCKCWAAALVAVLLLTPVAASADPAAEAYQKGRACFDKHDYDAAIAAFTEVIRLDPKNAKGFTTGAVPTRTRAISTSPSPTTAKPFASIQKTPRRITIGASSTTRRPNTIRRSPTSTRPSGSIQNLNRHFSTGVLPTLTRARTIGRLPTPTKPFGSIQNTPMRIMPEA